MIEREKVVRIGTLTKPHGVGGEMVLTLDRRVIDGDESPYLVCDMDGILVPFFLESVRDKSTNVLLVKFCDIDSVEAARRFQGVAVYFPQEYLPAVSEEPDSWDFFIGFKVTDSTEGFLGLIEDIDDSTPNVLFLVRNRGREMIIPANREWIEELDAENREIMFNLPEGLLDIQE
ncbi:MAG: ribosome maturation factor RimM [Bacteroidaceae bacterium]|nr:ribosome maturation factor RimM [Bacteroidaceae bacterium]